MNTCNENALCGGILSFGKISLRIVLPKFISHAQVKGKI
jgi:hypothetical protein